MNRYGLIRKESGCSHVTQAGENPSEIFITNRFNPYSPGDSPDNPSFNILILTSKLQLCPTSFLGNLSLKDIGYDVELLAQIIDNWVSN